MDIKHTRRVQTSNCNCTSCKCQKEDEGLKPSEKLKSDKGMDEDIMPARLLDGIEPDYSRIPIDFLAYTPGISDPKTFPILFGLYKFKETLDMNYFNQAMDLFYELVGLKDDPLIAAGLLSQMCVIHGEVETQLGPLSQHIGEAIKAFLDFSYGDISYSEGAGEFLYSLAICFNIYVHHPERVDIQVVSQEDHEVNEEITNAEADDEPVSLVGEIEPAELEK